MASCPDDGRELTPDPAGGLACRLCGGALCTEGELEAIAPSGVAALQVETRADSGAFARTRQCPTCQTPMVPLRIGPLDAWVERCPGCEALWVERQDRRSLVFLRQQQARAAAYRSLPPEERSELARDLAVAQVPGETELSAFHRVLVTLGLPVVTRTLGSRTPWATWGLALVLVALFGLALSGEGAEAMFEDLGYRTDRPSVLSAFTACFAHAGWLHLLGNVYFLLAFGDGVEQKVPRPFVVAAFMVLGAAAIAFDGALASVPTVVAGASGSVAVLMGACVVLQPQSRVHSRAFLFGPTYSVPIWVYGGFELGYQALMAAVGTRGVAWLTHLAGLALGAAFGLSVKWISARHPAAAAS